MNENFMTLPLFLKALKNSYFEMAEQNKHTWKPLILGSRPGRLIFFLLTWQNFNMAVGHFCCQNLHSGIAWQVTWDSNTLFVRNARVFIVFSPLTISDIGRQEDFGWNFAICGGHFSTFHYCGNSVGSAASHHILHQDNCKYCCSNHIGDIHLS